MGGSQQGLALGEHEEDGEAVEAERLLEGLDERQREAVTVEAAPLAILAGAGAGKTRVLTRRIAWRVATERAEAKHVLAVTFTRKAAGELGERLRALGVGDGVTAGTIHSIALTQLRRWAADRDRPMPEVLSRKARILVPLIGGRGRAAALAASEIAGEIEWAKARLVGPADFVAAVDRASRETPRPAAEVAELYERYEQEKKRRRVADFDDLLWWCADVLERDEKFAAAQHWRFRHLFVDEFQDISPAQARLVRAWLGGRDDLCVVGDPDQAIYAFAGADVGQLTGFTRTFRGGRVVRLECNYRSTPEVLAVAEAVLADAGRPRPARRAVRASAPRPIITAYDADDAEAAAVADGLQSSHAEGIEWSRLAVLYRTNAQSALFEEALTRADIPFRVRGDGRFLDRPEVVNALDQLRTAARNDTGRMFDDHLGDLESRGRDGSEQSREHVATLVRLGREYSSAEGGTGSVDGFVDFLTATLRGESPTSSGDAVELLTFHRAKGLEFDTVFVTGLERGLVPIAHAEAPEERAEERRLLYVALTRAERILRLSYAKHRTFGAHASNRARSPWLAPIEQALAAMDPGRPAPTPIKGIDAARQQLARAVSRDGADSPDPQLLEALKDWRRKLARASGVPAYVIFPDTTLNALAHTKPDNREALLDVPGIGPVKAERHGEAVLELLRRHAG
jgi:DNA helicase II / ATP-dependent DNA helicase PcrA